MKSPLGTPSPGMTASQHINIKSGLQSLKERDLNMRLRCMFAFATHGGTNAPSAARLKMALFISLHQLFTASAFYLPHRYNALPILYQLPMLLSVPEISTNLHVCS